MVPVGETARAALLIAVIDAVGDQIARTQVEVSRNLAQDGTKVPRQLFSPLVVGWKQRGLESFGGVVENELHSAGEIVATRGARQLTSGAVAPFDQPLRGFVPAFRHDDDASKAAGIGTLCAADGVTELERKKIGLQPLQLSGRAMLLTFERVAACHAPYFSF